MNAEKEQRTAGGSGEVMSGNAAVHGCVWANWAAPQKDTETGEWLAAVRNWPGK